MNSSLSASGNISANRNMPGCTQTQVTVSLQVTLTVLYAIIFPIALLGNSLVLYVVFQRQSMRSVLNLLIVNMAIADLLVTVFIMPYSVSYLFVGLRWFGGIFGLILCKTVHFSLTASIAGSVITLIVITVDRFVSIVFVWKRCLNLRTSKVALVVIWVVSIAIMGLHLEVYTVSQPLIANGDDRFYCYPDWRRMPIDFNKYFAVAVFVVLYATPLLLMGILYSFIAHKLRKESLAESIGSGGDAKINKSKKRVMKMLITVTVAFAVCWFPLHLLHYYIYFDQETYKCMSQLVIMLFFWLGHANSAINPILYVVFNKTFRRAFLHALHIESFQSIYLRSSFRRSSIRRPSTAITSAKDNPQQNGNNISGIHPSPDVPKMRSQKKRYGYGKLRHQSENSKSKSSDSGSDDVKSTRHSIIIVADRMTTV